MVHPCTGGMIATQWLFPGCRPGKDLDANPS